MDLKREAMDAVEDAFQTVGAEEKFMTSHAEDTPKGRPYKVRNVRPELRSHEVLKGAVQPRNDSHRICTNSPSVLSP